MAPTPACRRTVAQVYGDELDLALIKLAADAAGISADELMTRVARIYGWERVGSDIKERLSGKIAALLGNGDLRGTMDSLTRPQ
jgi:Protein of unknown function (DUF3320)